MNLQTMAGKHQISPKDLTRLIDEGGIVWLLTTGRFPNDLRCGYSDSPPKFSKDSRRRVLAWKVIAGGEMVEQPWPIPAK